MTTGEISDQSGTAHRFRSGADWFIAGQQHGVNSYCVGANSERIVDIMHALLVHLPDEVCVAVNSLRNMEAWHGGACARGDVRDVLLRLKLLLASYGGVEFAVYDTDDQLTLTPEVQLVVYSRSDRWRERLLDLGLEERLKPPTAVWAASRRALSHAPELLDSVALVVRRLGLAPAEFDVALP